MDCSSPDWAWKHLQARDGAVLCYRTCGSGPAVVLCDGIGCDGFIWKYLAPALEPHDTLIHLRRHGSSDSAQGHSDRKATVKSLQYRGG